jgi:signal peptidase
MTHVRVITRVGEALVVVLALGLLLGGILGQPIGLSYVETDSMEPTLHPGDGFIAVPQPIAGDIESGDVVVYRARVMHGGGLVTHRVVGQTDDGYITQGDANPFRDQQGGEPIVTEKDVVAHALQIGGEVVVVPWLGDAVERVQHTYGYATQQLGTRYGIYLSGPESIAYGLTVFSVLAYLFLTFREENQKTKTPEPRTYDRERGLNTNFLILALCLFIITSATMSMLVPVGTYSVSDRGNAEVTRVFNTSNNGYLPVVVFLESDTESVSVEPSELHLKPHSNGNATVTLLPGSSGSSLSSHRYLALLPTSLLRALYQFHPWAPIVAIDALIGIPFYLLGVRLVGTGRIRNRSRGRDLPALTRLRRMLRNLI